MKARIRVLVEHCGCAQQRVIPGNAHGEIADGQGDVCDCREGGHQHSSEGGRLSIEAVSPDGSGPSTTAPYGVVAERSWLSAAVQSAARSSVMRWAAWRSPTRLPAMWSTSHLDC